MLPLSLVCVLHERGSKSTKSPNLFSQQYNRNRKFLRPVLSLYVTSFNKKISINEDSKSEQKCCAQQQSHNAGSQWQKSASLL